MNVFGKEEELLFLRSGKPSTPLGLLLVLVLSSLLLVASHLVDWKYIVITAGLLGKSAWHIISLANQSPVRVDTGVTEYAWHVISR